MSGPRPRVETIAVSFPGGAGHQLSGRLVLPPEEPRAFALLTHCFTCTKDLKGIVRTAAALAEAGIAVLRFDFTGLGESDGDFAHTTFGDDVADVVAAAAWLRTHHQAPRLLAGFSLGGAACIVAATEVPETRAVATYGAPSSTEHVLRLFTDVADEIERTGSAEVVLAGRTFRIGRDFLAGLATDTIGPAAARLEPPLLLVHAPGDRVVPVEHASNLFRSTPHPKSFVALDGADHLLDDRADAAYLGGLIAAWASRYLS